MKKNYPCYRLFKGILGPIFRLWYNPKVINKEYLNVDGPIIIAGNHKHIYDQCLTIISTKRMINYMAKKEYFDDKKVAWFFKAAGCIPVNRQTKDTAAVESALEVLNNNGAIGIFPEGTRNKTDKFLLPFKFGVVSMAKKTGATIVPFGLTGDYKFRSKNLVARFGKPFKIGDMSLEEANDKLFNDIKKLMEENLKAEN
ncbi:MAG: 1-acyl-sn-glycerol-3-phosphate acyltransferase [Bacilli bacterium]|nr:1-acyl-sn-glycerol-3-phosphate acyltransferase [Bacilli bacterium]